MYSMYVRLIELALSSPKLLPANDKYSRLVPIRLSELYGALAKLFRANDRNLMGMYVVTSRFSARRCISL